MEKTQVKRLLSLVLCVMMVLSLMPSVAFAAEDNDAPEQSVESTVVPTEEETSDPEGADEAIAEGEEPAPSEASEDENTEETVAVERNIIAYGNSYDIAPGVVESNLTMNDSTGENPNKAYVFHVEKGAENAYTMASYKGLDGRSGGAQTVSAQAAYAEESLGVNVVGAINVNWRSDSDEPMGMLIINGDVQHTEICSYAYFVQNTDGTYELREGTDPLTGSEQNAVTFGDWLVKDGVNQYSEDYSQDNRAPRTAIGLKADGSLVVFVSEGSPISAGLTPYETAKVLLDLGCVNAVSCTGDGTFAFLSKRDSADELKLRNATVSGTEDETHTGLLIVSTVEEIEEPASSEVDSEEDSVLPSDAEADESDSAAESETASSLNTGTDTNDTGDGYNILVSQREYSVAPGVSEKTLVLNDASGNNQNLCYVMEVDLSNDNVDLLSGYSNMDPSTWATQTTSAQAKAAEEKLGVNVVGAINTNLSWASNEPLGMLVINGVVYHQGTAQAYFVLTKDGKAEIRSGNEPLQGNEWQATSTFQFLVQNGKSLYTTPDHANGSRAPRTAIGIKADGSVVLFVVDGRQAPSSVGMSAYELAQTMIDLGCVTAVNCDGGGTSTFVSERAGTGTLKIQNNPSDGAERPTLGTLMVVSKAKSTGIFDHAALLPNNDLYTPGSTVQFSAIGSDSSGSKVAVPETATWRLSEDSAALGTIDAANGLFVAAKGATGNVTVELVYEDEVVGSTSIQLVHPDLLAFNSDEMSLGFSVTNKLGLVVKYKNQDVNYNSSDFTWSQSDDRLGTFNDDGTYTTNDSLTLSGTITVTYIADTTLSATMNMIVGKLPTVIWDFEDVTTVDEGTGETIIIPAEEYYTIDQKDEAGNNTGLLYTSNYNRGGVQSAEIVSIDDNEPVRMGSHSLKLNYDFRNCGAVTEGALIGTSDAFSIPGSPTAIGVWVYAPEGTGIIWGGEGTTAGLWLRGYYKDSTGSTCQYDFTFEPKVFGADESTWPDEYPGIWWEGWHYCEAKLNGNAPYSILPGMTFRLMYVYSTQMGEKSAGSIYFDNFQFVYGTNVDDTDAPYVNVISAQYNGEQKDIEEGTTIPSNSMGFYFNCIDVENKYTSGVDAATTRIYIDGVNVIGDEYYNTYVDPDGGCYVYNVTLKNGRHSITVSGKDNAGNEFEETRSFIVDGSSDLSDIPDVSFSCAETAAMLGGKMNISLCTTDASDVKSYSFGVKIDRNFPDFTVTFADGYEGTYSYNKLTKLIQVEAAKTSENAGNVVATISVDVPTTLKSWDTFSYSVGNCQYVTSDGKKYTYSQDKKTYEIDCMYTISADPILVGEDGVITITSKGASLAGVGIYKEDGTLIGKTDESGKLITDFLSSSAANATIYAKDDEGRLSFTYAVSSFATQGDETCAPFGVMNHASANGGLENSVTWFTNPNAEAQKLQYKLSDADEWITVDAASARITFTKEGNTMVCVHSAIIRGLNANAQYVYRVGDGTLWSNEYIFKTDNRDGNVKFFILGDIQTEDLAQVTQIVARLNEGDYDFGIQTGDAVDDASSYAYWKGIIGLLGADALGDTDVIHVLGNHEFAGDAAAERSTKIYNLPTSGYGGHYSVVYDNVYVAVINYTSNKRELAAALEWLKTDAANSNAAWKILTIHQPAYYTNTSGGNNEIHDMLPAAAEEAGIDFVFSGHDHSYARTLPMTNGQVDEKNGVVYFICGSTGEKAYSVTNTPEFNFDRVISDYNSIYLFVEADESKITIHCKELSGEELDTYTKEKTVCTEHEYVYSSDTNALTCSKCGGTIDFASYSGVYRKDGKLYYAIKGVNKSGWKNVNGVECYFMPDTFEAANGSVTASNGVTFDFVDGVVQSGVWVTNENGSRYYYGSGYYMKKNSVASYIIDGNRYFFDKDGYMQTGIVHEYDKVQGCNVYYDCGTDGIAVLFNGMTDDRICINGVPLKPYYGLAQWNGDFYYVNDNSKIVKNTRKFVNTTNGLTFADGTAVPRAYFDFDENGKMLLPNGVVDDYFYINGVKAKPYYGLAQWNGDFYYVNDNSKIVKNTRKFVNTTNGLTFADGTAVPRAYFDFDENGKMLLPNGVVDDYFYINGVKAKPYYGLVQWNGDFYYVNDNSKIVKNTRKFVNTTNGLTFADGTAVPRAYFDFDENGKMLLLNGVVDDYFYINGVKAKPYYGLVQWNGDFYYVNDNSKIVKNTRKFVNTTNGLTFADGTAVPRAYFNFDENGRMIIN